MSRRSRAVRMLLAFAFCVLRLRAPRHEVTAPLELAVGQISSGSDRGNRRQRKYGRIIIIKKKGIEAERRDIVNRGVLQIKRNKLYGQRRELCLTASHCETWDFFFFFLSLLLLQGYMSGFILAHFLIPTGARSMSECVREMNNSTKRHLPRGR